MVKKTTVLFFLLIFMGKISGFSQVSEGGIPYSFQVQTQQKIPTIKLPLIDIEKVRKEDETLGFTRQAITTELNFNLNNSGNWINLPKGDRLWQLSIKVENALFLTFTSTDFFIPKGGKLFIYDKSKQQILGAYTHNSNNLLKSFSSQEIKGNEMIIEYYEPAEIKGQSKIQIDRVYQGYKLIDFQITDTDKNYLYNSIKGFGDSQSCHVNAQCDSYDVWDEQRRSVARIWITSTTGGGWCSGGLINNTNNDETPYFLSAWHCQAGGTQIYSTWRFDFEYEHPTCSNGAEPTANSITGATELVKSESSDVLLLQLSSLPAGSNHYLAGWNRENVAATSVFGFHHPRGDVKKASRSNSNAFSNSSPVTFGGLSTPLTIPAGNLWGCIWDEGTTEGGSSGSPLFDNDRRIVGQLTGGSSSCANPSGGNWYGKLSASWSFLQPYLDPSNSGILTLDGFDGTIALVNNVRVTEINTNTSPCLFTNSTDIEVVVQNFGQNPQTNIPIEYELRDASDNSLLSSSSTTTTGTLNTSETTTITFSVDMANSGDYEFIARTLLVGDENLGDDEKEESFSNVKPTIGASNIQITGADERKGFTVTWDRGNGENVIVLVKEESDFTSADLPVDGDSYSANSIYGVGSTVGSALVVYKGSLNSVSVSELNLNREYFVAVIEFSCVPEDYLLEDILYSSETVTNLEDELARKIEIYPNPVSEEFTIKFKDNQPDSDFNLTIYQNTGKVVKRLILEKGSQEYKVNTKGLAKGMYFVKITSSDKKIFKKIIIE